jgi:hypothetical protein
MLATRGMTAWIMVVNELIPPMPLVPAPSSEAIGLPLPVLREVLQLIGGVVMTLVCRGLLEE